MYNLSITQFKNCDLFRHHELLDQEGLYHRMWNQQLQDENQPEEISDKKGD